MQTHLCRLCVKGCEQRLRRRCGVCTQQFLDDQRVAISFHDGASAADADSQERRPNFPAREGYPQRPSQPRQSNYGQGGYQRREGGFNRNGNRPQGDRPQGGYRKPAENKEGGAQ